MTGASVAYHLTNFLNQESTLHHTRPYNSSDSDSNTTSLLLLDARGASGGATGRNGGGLGPTGYSSFNQTLTKFDNQTAIEEYNFTLSTVYDVIDFINNNNLSNADLQMHGSFTPINTSIESLNDINESINLMHSMNVRLDEILLTNDTIIDNLTNTNYWKYGVYSHISSMFWPAKVVFQLLNLTILNSNSLIHKNSKSNVNLNIQFETTVVNVSSAQDESEKNWNNYNINFKDGGYLIHTDRGTVLSKIVVFATNGYTSYLLPQFTDLIIPMKNQVIMSKPFDDGTSSSSLIWPYLASGFGNDYEYWGQRWVDKRILIGGGRDAVGNNNNEWIGDYNDSVINQNVSEYLQSYLNKYFKNIINNTNEIKIDYEWQGIMGLTKDGYPYIGPIVNMTNAYVVAGFNGDGMDQTFNAGKAIAAMIVGKNPMPFVDIFLPTQQRMQL